MQDIGYMPDRIVAGESIWIAAANTAQALSDITLTGYVPPTYTLSYQFAAATPITVAAVANGADTGWTLEVTAAQTLVWKAGEISFAGYVTHASSGRIFAVDAGTIAVTASPLATSSWTAIVTACDAALLTQATTGNQSGTLSMDNMTESYTYRNTADLITLRAYAQNMASYEIGPRQKRIIRTRFT